MIYRITALAIMACFYFFYLLKLVIQKKKSIVTNQIGKGNKPQKVLITERVMSAATVFAVLTEVGSILLCDCSQTNLKGFLLMIIGVVTGVAAILCFALATISMKTSWRVGIPEEKTAIITNGIYSFSRNPAFVGFDLLYISILCMFFNVPLLVVSAWAGIMLHLQILQEEKWLEKTFGKEYTDYKQRVNRYFGRNNKITKFLFAAVGIVCLLVIINFIPTWNLKTHAMSKLDGKWITVYYEKEATAAEDVFELADKETQKIADKLGFSEKQDVNIYIYDNQSVMQRKKYGLLAPMLGLDWYIGDNIGTDVILTSPANPGPVHDYENNKYAVLHEIVHAYISVKNPNVPLWITEGMALYLTNGEPFYKAYLENRTLPSYQDTRTRNPIRFTDCGGYTVAHTYIEYLDKTYGWDKVCRLVAGEQYQSLFGKSEKAIYEEWVDYLKNYPQ